MRRIALLMCAALAALIAAPLEADARGRRLEGVVTGARGHQATVARDISARGRDRSAHTSISGENGRTRDVWRSRDIDPGARSRSSDVTFSDGATRSVDRTATRTAPGEWTVEREVTGRNGETRTQTGSANVTHTDQGRTVNGSLTGPLGDSSFERSVSHEDGVRTVTGATSGPMGGAPR